MSTITKNALMGSTPSTGAHSLFSVENGEVIHSNITAGEAIAELDAIRLTAASGWIRCDAGQGGFEGFAPQAYAAGDYVSALANGVVIEYADAGDLAVGSLYYRGANGALDSSQTGSDPAIAKCIQDGLILVINAGAEASSS